LKSFDEKVYAIVKKVPRGKVTTYKKIGEKLGTKAYRAIGQALRRNPYAPKVPCHRVIRSDLSIGGFKGKTKGKFVNEKIKLLKKEGVEIKNNKVKKEFILSSFS
jgi:methylated-DNA-[protein]-cysteine S-methyltransferase